jgi:hypothetical protein
MLREKPKQTIQKSDGSNRALASSLAVWAIIAAVAGKRTVNVFY